MEHLLITGASGKLGREIAKVFPYAFTPSHEELDITDLLLVDDYLKRNKIESIIHCAALTSVRLCDEERDWAYWVNVEGTYNLLRPDIYFIYISTACVFPGKVEDGMYFEDDEPAPVNYYGFTKMEAERYVRLQGNSLIVRTNFAPRGKWPYSHAFIDRFGTYLYPDQIAKKLAEIYTYKPRGVIHICGDRVFSMYQFARLEDPSVKPTTLEEYQGPHLTRNMALGSLREGEVRFEY